MAEVDDAAVARWLEPLASSPGDVAEVFLETRRRTAVDWLDGEPGDVRVAIEAGVSARFRRAGRERLAFVSGAGEAEVREAIRGLTSSTGKAPVTTRAVPRPPLEVEPDPAVDRWVLPVWVHWAAQASSVVSIAVTLVLLGLGARASYRFFRGI